MNERREPPEWVVHYVCALMRGYDYRRQYMELYSSPDNKVRRLYSKYNDVIDEALAEQCTPAEAESVRKSLMYSLSYERVGKCPCGRRRFFEIRGEVIFSIARKLHIL